MYIHNSTTDSGEVKQNSHTNFTKIKVSICIYPISYELLTNLPSCSHLAGPASASIQKKASHVQDVALSQVRKEKHVERFDCGCYIAAITWFHKYIRSNHEKEIKGSYSYALLGSLLFKARLPGSRASEMSSPVICLKPLSYMSCTRSGSGGAM